MRERDIFIEALQQSDPARRTALLDDACRGDATLRKQVERLLAEHERQESFILDTPPADLDATSLHLPIAERSGTVIGPYKLLQQIGEGGMGVVFLAQQSVPIKRSVALKIIKPGMDTRQVIARFDAERHALALMDHPNIAKVLDAGTTDTGRPYFVMELVKGVPITEFCDDRKLTPRQRLELFIPVCQAIQHAHQKGIIHRDIKPSNVMISLYDDRPVPKVIDFGVAKATGQALTEQTLNTGFSVVGTPQYMSPEQATFNQLDVDTRSDVYSLGVLLYELLAGSPPFKKQEIEQAGYLEMLRVIREDEPPRPSTKLSTAEGLPSLSANRSTEPAKLTGMLRNELDWIVMMALEKDRARRYETVNGFAADVNRYLAGEPVLAHPPSKTYRVQKFLRKNQGLVIAASLVALTLVGGMMGTTWGLIRAEASRRDAVAARIAESERADGERLAKQQALDEKKKAQEAEADALVAYRASADEAIEQLIGSKPELGPQEKAYLENTLERWKKFADRNGDDEGSRAIRAEGHSRVSRLWQKLGRNAEAQTESQHALAILEKLAAEFPAVPEYRNGLAESHNSLAILLKELGKRTEAEGHFRTALAIREKLVTEFPAEAAYRLGLGNSHTNLGMLLNELGNRAEAEVEYRNALEISERLAAEFPAESEYRTALAFSHDNLGTLLSELGKRAESEQQHRKALAIAETLANDFPGVPAHRFSLANISNNLGNLLKDLGRQEEAHEQYRKAVAIKEQLAAEFPAVPEYREELLASHANLGNLLADLGRKEEAAEQYRKATTINERLVAEFPAVPKYRNDLANLHYSMGVGGETQDSSQKADAAEQHRKALAIHEKLTAEFPTVPEYSTQLGDEHNNLGNLLENQGQRAEAETEYRIALAMQEKLVAEFPEAPEHHITLAGCYCNLGILIRNGGQPRESLDWFDKAIHTLAPVYEADRQSVQARTFLRNSYWGRAQAYEQLRRYAEAANDWGKTIDLSLPQQQRSMRATRAKLRHLAGQTADAVTEVAELTAPGVDVHGSPQWSALEWYNFACIYSVASHKIADKQQEYSDRAMELLQRSVKAGWKDAAGIAKDADFDPLRDREDFKKLTGELERAFPVTPAEKLREPTLPVRPAKADADPPEAIEAVQRLAKLYGEMGKSDEAKALLQQTSDAHARDPQIFAQFGDHFARQGEWKLAAPSFTHAYDLNPVDEKLILSAAVSALEAGDLKSYRRVCQQALAQFAATDDPATADRTAKAGLLTAEPGSDLTQLVKLAEVAVENGKEHKWINYFQLDRGIAAYRTGDWAGTLDWCARSRKQGGNSLSAEALCLLFEAMAHHQLNHADQTGVAMGRATALIDEYLAGANEDRGAEWKFWLICQITRREAEELLKPKSPVGDRKPEKTEQEK